VAEPALDVERSFLIYDAVHSMLWPGEAAVAVSIVHLAAGRPQEHVRSSCRLDGLLVRAINSRLDPGTERSNPVGLAANGELSFLGCKIGGQGFLLTHDERGRLADVDPRNGERIFPYLGGEEVNTGATQSFDRYVIDFGQMGVEEAERWPALLQIVREKVKPYREGVNRESWQKRWWQFAEVYPRMRAAIAPLDRCLVTARVTKHLCFSFQPTDRVLNEKLYVFPFDRVTAFAVLQARVHVSWTWLLSSTMKNDLNYSASDCFDTFPFPRPDPRTVIPELEDIGQRLYDARAGYMVGEQVGLTITYNRLKDPASREPRIEELRRLHEEMDSAVLAAYGWSDISVPPFVTPTTPADKKTIEAFEGEVIDRLFVLNAQRAEEERVKGLTGGRKGKAKGTGASRRKTARGTSVDRQLSISTETDEEGS
jgi:hypothetical protein